MMADLTEEEEERLEPQPHVKANIPAIAALLEANGRVAKAEEKAQKARSDLGNIYQKIENDHHGHRGAAKQIRTLLAGTTDAAYDYMRTFIPLAQHFGLIPENDLADQAEGGEAGGQVFEFPGRARGPSAIDRARQHLEGGTKPKDEESDADRQKRERREAFGFDENAPPGEPGDGDLARAGEGAGSQGTEAAE